MNTNESTDIVRACAECGAEVGPVRHKCDKCYNRSNYNDETHELALAEDLLRRGKHSLDEVYHGYAYSYDRRMKAEREITDGGDYRIEGLWQKLWKALDGDIERHDTWGMFMDAIPGLPDYRIKTYSGTLTLKFHFSGIEIPGDTDSRDIESALYEAMTDLGYATTGDEDDYEVYYDED
jgi:hypothetical protein